MARLNNDAREILCNMVSGKASEKRAALVAELDGLEQALNNDYKKRLEAARPKIDEAIQDARKKINDILTTYELQFGSQRYEHDVYNINDIIDCGGNLIKPSLLVNYIRPVKEASNKRREGLKQDIEDLDAKVAKAKQEILLRAALGMKYDEVVGIINSFEF